MRNRNKTIFSHYKRVLHRKLYCSTWSNVLGPIFFSYSFLCLSDTGQSKWEKQVSDNILSDVLLSDIAAAAWVASGKWVPVKGHRQNDLFSSDYLFHFIVSNVVFSLILSLFFNRLSFFCLFYYKMMFVLSPYDWTKKWRWCFVL